jgi:tetratricopeptide (TPR) repeat protein
MRVEYYRYIRDEKVSNMGKIATWKFMISRYGEKPELYYNIAETYQLMNQVDSARIYIMKAKSLLPDGELKEKIGELEKKTGR